jgi:branched-subunit amino acid ABC-type transport system permease component
MLEPLVQNLVFGVLVGALYGLAAVGLSLVFGVTKILNVAHGELLMFGGYASFWAVTLLGIDPFLSLIPAVIFLAVIGFILYKLVFSRLVKLDESVKIQNTLLVGFGLSLILQKHRPPPVERRHPRYHHLLLRICVHALRCTLPHRAGGQPDHCACHTPGA